MEWRGTRSHWLGFGEATGITNIGTREAQSKSTSTTVAETFDIIVSTGGARDPFRTSSRSIVEPIYSGVCWLALYILNLPAEEPDLNQMIGGGTFPA